MIITDATSSWPANSKWNKKFFSDKFGDQKLHVKLGKNGIFEGPELRSKWADSSRQTLPKFIKDKLEFPELVMERPGGAELSVDQILWMFQNHTRVLVIL